MTEHEHDAARELVRRAHEADPTPVEFDTASGLAAILDRASRSAEATPEGEPDAGRTGDTREGAFAKAQQSILDFLLRVGVDGFGTLDTAQESARETLRRSHGNREKAVRRLIRQHVALAGTQGFVTNLGGLVTMVIALPANVVAANLINTHLVASIAAVHGHDVESEELRTAILVCLLRGAGANTLEEVGIKQFSRKVAATLATTYGGKNAGVMVTKGVPLFGGVVGGVVDAASTRAVGTFARRFFTSPTVRPLGDNSEADQWNLAFAVARAQREGQR